MLTASVIMWYYVHIASKQQKNGGNADMKQTKIIFKKIDKCTEELLNSLSEKENIYFRFHDPKRRISSRSKSWGMIYTSEREAIADGSDILYGKSCVETAAELMDWKNYFDENYVVIAFEGIDTRQSGHDGETVSTYQGKVATFSYQDFVNMFEEKHNGCKWEWVFKKHN